MPARVIEISSVVVFFIGFYGLITSRNIIKTITAITVLEMAVIVFFLGLGFTDGMAPPIGEGLENATDPLPQAFVLTAIVIGVAVTAINLTMLISLSHRIKKTDWDSVRSASSQQAGGDGDGDGNSDSDGNSDGGSDGDGDGDGDSDSDGNSDE